MSVRLLTHRLFNHGRYFIQNYCKRQIHTNILEGKRNIGSATVAVNTKANNLRQVSYKWLLLCKNNSTPRSSTTILTYFIMVLNYRMAQNYHREYEIIVSYDSVVDYLLTTY